MARLKLIHFISTGILIIGILGILYGLIAVPEKFPVASLFLAKLLRVFVQRNEDYYSK